MIRSTMFHIRMKAGIEGGGTHFETVGSPSEGDISVAIQRIEMLKDNIIWNAEVKFRRDILL